MTPDAGLALSEPTDPAALRDELIALCAQAFCGPPWHEPPRGAVRTVDRLLGVAGRPGFRMVAAHDADGALTGIAAGWPDTVLSGGEQAFELYELVVAPAHQGRGLGRALHDGLLALAPGPRLLMTLDVPELRGRYERWGWNVVEHRAPERVPQNYVVMRAD
ncbi:GNAT family N-acetyltransferase [Streptomyces sp.]|uniref:GNAT family N-acetyltransferase n=1 Tax=Streptomyces sp. TaxID=1931 RepID=UPI002F94AA78